MIRFLPDSLREALLRPLAMAAPDGGVYTEIIAPDFRFALALLLAFVVVVAGRAAVRRNPAPAWLLALTAAAFVPWLVTSGNGRYFMAFLLMAGPLCVGLAHLLPGTRALRMTVVLAMVGWQAMLLTQAVPWRSWNHLSWGEGEPFAVDIPADVRARPATFVTLSSISYSLIAPRFHPDSRWINIAGLKGADDPSADGRRAKALLDASTTMFALFPTLPGGQDSGTMDPALAQAIDDLLARQALSLADAGACRFMPSRGLVAMAERKLGQGSPGTAARLNGFWLCPLQHGANPQARKAAAIPARALAAFERLEQACPRLFPPGDAIGLRIPLGVVRGYPSSDFKLYVQDDGIVWFKYFRALNGVRVGTVDEVMKPGFHMDCDHVTGRTGLPWERGL
ncbi:MULTISPECIES: hypothetical protein [Ramlibacter]|uniref:Uncharacterized protein n=1 Tax=Ramlibacter aquaticus TaxID=2780094 RepID=A0ABR9SAS3_9BURK|nr:MULTISPECIES: hypothetical protein [Ramlibacter]MBE7939431.1 hypothetical protein [Ramlibacter aquaticus]